MATWSITTALAVPFVVAGTSFDIILGSTGATTYTVTITAGTRRIALAPAASDLLRLLQTAMNAAAGLPGGVSFAVALSSTTGLITVTCTGDTFAFVDLHSQVLGRILGFTVAGTAAASKTATYAPWYLALFVGAYGGVWTPRRSGARERTEGGVVYTFAGTSATWDREVTADLIPWGPTEATEAESPGTPMWPLPAYREALGVTSTARAWSLLDVWVAAQNAGASIGCALALGTWALVSASTSETYDVGSLASDLLEPTRQDERWNRYVSAIWGFVLPSTGQTGVRA